MIAGSRVRRRGQRSQGAASLGRVAHVEKDPLSGGISGPDRGSRTVRAAGGMPGMHRPDRSVADRRGRMVGRSITRAAMRPDRGDEAYTGEIVCTGHCIAGPGLSTT